MNDNACHVWYDEGIAAGRKWRDEIAETILASSAFSVFLSPRCTVSEECLKEIGFALDQQIPILAVFLEQFGLSPGMQLSLQNRQALERCRYADDAYHAKVRARVTQIIEKGHVGTRRFETGRTQAPADAGFDPRYILHSQVADGASGVVCRAVDQIKSRIVTIKREKMKTVDEVSLATEF